jgi:peptide/nickel transport system substrate-binding protein
VHDDIEMVWPNGETGRISRRDLIAAGIGAGALLSAGPVTGAARAALTATPKRGGVMQIAFAHGTVTLDPALTGASSAYDSIAAGGLYDLLVELDDSWKSRPGLAERWTISSDVKTWTLFLRKNVRFHNGQPVTAGDVVYSVRRVLSKDLGSPIQSRISASLDPSGVRALNKSTVQFRLKVPDAFFHLVLGARQLAVIPQGNPTYWKRGRPYLDGLRAVTINEQSTKIRSVVSGDSHIAENVDYTAISSVKGSSRAKILNHKNARFFNVIFDPNVEPFTNNRVRTAIKLAIDRARILNIVQQGQGTIGNDVPAPRSDPFYPRGFAARKQDYAAGRELLRQAGLGDGLELTLRTSDAEGGMVNYAVLWAQMLQPLGIQVKVTQGPASSYWDQVWLKEPFYTSAWGRRHPSEDLGIKWVSDAPWNEAKFKSAALDRMVVDARRARTTQRQTALIGNALRMIGNQAGLSLPTFGSRLFVAKQQVQGVKLNLLYQANFTNAYLS